jgi:hypothetical protein
LLIPGRRPPKPILPIHQFFASLAGLVSTSIITKIRDPRPFGDLRFGRVPVFAAGRAWRRTPITAQPLR